MEIFRKYFNVGIINTLIHWIIFYISYTLTNIQSISNFIGFFIAVSFSYVFNSLYTFKQKTSPQKYIIFLFFMSVLSFSLGYISDITKIQPIFTLIIFSSLSLVIGFIFSKYIVFKE